jgi:hypothetical protein
MAALKRMLYISAMIITNGTPPGRGNHKLNKERKRIMIMTNNEIYNHAANLATFYLEERMPVRINFFL